MGGWLPSHLRYLQVSALRIAGVALLLLAILIPVLLPMDSTASSPLGQILPGGLLYRFHAVAGTVINGLGGSPSAAAIQWVKAASHADSPPDIQRAGIGINVARARATNTTDANELDETLCEVYRHGNPAVQTAIQQTHLPCTAPPG